MTKINKIFSFYNVQSHKEREAVTDLLENHLPFKYAETVVVRLKSKGIEVSNGMVRNVKSGINKNIAVFNEIITLAKETKALSKQMKKNLIDA